MSECAALYIDLMKRCLTDSVHGRTEWRAVRPSNPLRRLVVGACAAQGVRLVRVQEVDDRDRSEGRHWPSVAHTMIGAKRLDNLQHCIEDVLARSVPGDFIETGVWRGGSTIFMRAALKAYGDASRIVWVADSFEGLPAPSPDKYPMDTDSGLHLATDLAVSLDEVRSNFERYGLLDDQVRFLKGWFRDTLPAAPMQRLAIIRLDGDMYESTMDALTALYPKLSRGGYLIVDDYGAIAACRQAVHDYRSSHGVDEEIRPIDWSGVYWRRDAEGLDPA